MIRAPTASQAFVEAASNPKRRFVGFNLYFDTGDRPELHPGVIAALARRPQGSLG